MGQFDFARSFLERAEALGEGVSDPDPVFVLRLQIARAYVELASGHLAKGLVGMSRARMFADRTGDTFSRVAASTSCVVGFSLVGACERAEAAAREVERFSEATFWIDYSAFYLAYARACTHGARRGPEAIASLRALVDRRDPLLVECARAVLALALATTGDFDGAAREATTLSERGFMFPQQTQTSALGALALVALHQGQPADALALTKRGLDVHSWQFAEHTESILHLAHAEALHALGRTQDEHAAIREARDRILSIAATLDDAELRESYVTHVDANARTLKLAGEWLGGEPASS